MADAVRLSHQDVFYEYRSNEIARYITEHPEYERIVIALSGDVGFYSGAKKLLDLLGPDTEVICGISSVVYLWQRSIFPGRMQRLSALMGKPATLCP